MISSYTAIVFREDFRMDSRWWFFAICEFERAHIRMDRDDYMTYLSGEVLDNRTELAMTS